MVVGEGEVEPVQGGDLVHAEVGAGPQQQEQSVAQGAGTDAVEGKQEPAQQGQVDGFAGVARAHPEVTAHPAHHHLDRALVTRCGHAGEGGEFVQGREPQGDRGGGAGGD